MQVLLCRRANEIQERKTVQLKKCWGDSLWNDNPHKKCHKDIDARWTKKRRDTFYVYKNHAKVCRKTQLITGYDTTSVSVHDSKRGAELVNDNDAVGEKFWLDAGYVGTEDGFASKSVTPIICEKGFRGHPLNEEQNRTIAINQRFVVVWNMCLVLLSVQLAVLCFAELALSGQRRMSQ